MRHTSPLRKRAEAGDSTAQNNLATKYNFGQGVEQDYAEAMKWFRKAAEQGVAGAQFSVGLMHYNGRGVEKDNVDAYAWINLSAGNGLPGSVERLDKLEQLMSSKQVANAQKRTAELKKLIAKRKRSQSE